MNFQSEMITHKVCMLAEGLGAGLSFNKVACTLLKIIQFVWKLSVRASMFWSRKLGFFNILSLCLFGFKNAYFDDLTDTQKPHITEIS